MEGIGKCLSKSTLLVVFFTVLIIVGIVSRKFCQALCWAGRYRAVVTALLTDHLFSRYFVACQAALKYGCFSWIGWVTPDPAPLGLGDLGRRTRITSGFAYHARILWQPLLLFPRR